AQPAAISKRRGEFSRCARCRADAFASAARAGATIRPAYASHRAIDQSTRRRLEVTMPEEQRTMDFRQWVAVIGTMVGAFMAVLDIQITNSSLRDIAGGIAATPDEGSWISTAYLVGEIITIALTAWLADVFTLRYYLLTNVVLFLIFSALFG